MRENTKSLLQSHSAVNNFTKPQLNALAYSYPYHMNTDDSIKASDCRLFDSIEQEEHNIE